MIWAIFFAKLFKAYFRGVIYKVIFGQILWAKINVYFINILPLIWDIKHSNFYLFPYPKKINNLCLSIFSTRLVFDMNNVDFLFITIFLINFLSYLLICFYFSLSFKCHNFIFKQLLLKPNNPLLSIINQWNIYWQFTFPLTLILFLI